MAQSGEHAALVTMLGLRARCAPAPLHSLWLQHTGEILLRGALLRGERRRAAELLAQQQALLTASGGPSDATCARVRALHARRTRAAYACCALDKCGVRAWSPVASRSWEHELELLLQNGELLAALTRADEMGRKPTTGRGAGAASPKALLLLMEAKAHAAGGEPLSVLPHALSAMALAEKASLMGLHAAAALELVAVQARPPPLRPGLMSSPPSRHPCRLLAPRRPTRAHDRPPALPRSHARACERDAHGGGGGVARAQLNVDAPRALATLHKVRPALKQRNRKATRPNPTITVCGVL